MPSFFLYTFGGYFQKAYLCSIQFVHDNFIESKTNMKMKITSFDRYIHNHISGKQDLEIESVVEIPYDNSELSLSDRLFFFVNPWEYKAADKLISGMDVTKAMAVTRSEIVSANGSRHSLSSSVLRYMVGTSSYSLSNDDILNLFPDSVRKAITVPSVISYSQEKNCLIIMSIRSFLIWCEPLSRQYMEILPKRWEDNNVRFRLKDNDELFKIKDNEPSVKYMLDDDADYASCAAEEDLTEDFHEDEFIGGAIEEEDEEIIRRMQEEFRILSKRGYSEALIHRLLQGSQKASKLVVTKDFRIMLDDYSKEIKLGPREKAFYFLFLRHPKGINYLDMGDYSDELYRIYRKISPRFDSDKLNKSISSLVQYDSNDKSICTSRIKKSFLAQIDDSLASKYYIKGDQGDVKGIELDRSMVIWECNL